MINYEKHTEEFTHFLSTEVLPEYFRYAKCKGNLPTVLYLPMKLLTTGHICIGYFASIAKQVPKEMSLMGLNLEWNGDEEGDRWWVGMDGETCPTMIPS